jgi:hypothetical protein
VQPVKPIHLEPYVSTTLGNASDRRAITAEQVRSMVPDRYPVYAVVATPKSGSTFLASVLGKSLDLPFIPLCYAYSSNEHDLYLPALVTATACGAVSQLHMKGTPHNVQLLNLFGIRPIVLTRNLFDSIESLARDLRKKCESPGLGQGHSGYSFTWLTQDVADLDDGRLIDFVIDFAVPWYVNFYASWQNFARTNAIDPIFLRYEDLMMDKVGEVSRIMRAIGGAELPLDPDVLGKNHIRETSTIGRGSGESGLGLQRLSNAQVAAVRRLLSYYTNADFESWLT